MALSGHLSDLSLSELIEFFCNQRKTGQLKVLYPQGPGCFYLQNGSVVDARIGVIRGIDAVYYALTLPNAKFEFSGSVEMTDRTINQPWTQVVLEGLRRLDEGIEPPEAFTSTYVPDDELGAGAESVLTERQESNVPGFLSFLQNDTMTSRKPLILGAVAVAVLASVAVIGVPAGWYKRPQVAVASSQPATETTTPEAQPSAGTETPAPAETVGRDTQANDDAALAARRQREKERKVREERNSAGPIKASINNAPVTSVVESGKPGQKRVTVTVTYDESGRVTQASGADPTAIRIARQKRFPVGKAGSATVTIPIN
ncbi:MAG: DUF4388 domain-containing protein [Pyrinomonadaceae bacterium]